MGAIVLGQGTYEDHNPFAYLSAASPFAWVHFDVVPNLRLSAAFQEIFYREVAPLGLRDGHREAIRRAGQAPAAARNSGALRAGPARREELDNPGGTHRIVYRPRFRIGQGLNLDAVRIHSLVLFQEVAFRFSDASYTERAFESFRAFIGYMWTTRRGAFVTLGFVGQITLNPAATRYDFLYGPALNVAYRFRSAAKAEAPPVPPDVDVP